MSARVLIIISSSDREVIWTALLYARSASASDWMGAVQVIIWGPSSSTIAADKELRSNVRALTGTGQRVYVCKACSDRYGASEELMELGCDVEYVGPISSRYIEEGYAVFNW